MQIHNVAVLSYGRDLAQLVNSLWDDKQSGVDVGINKIFDALEVIMLEAECTDEEVGKLDRLNY